MDLLDLPTGSEGKPPRHYVATTRMMARALAEGWPLSAEQRQECVDAAFDILRDPKSTSYHRLGALRVIGLWSRENAYRSRTAAIEDYADLRAQTDRLAAAMRNPKYADLFEQLCEDLRPQNQPALPEGQSPPPQGNTPSGM
jgi:hypothetical protein